MKGNTLIYVLGAIAVVALGIGAWLMVGGKTGGSSSTGTTTDQTASAGGTLSIGGLLASNSPQKCTFTSTTENSNSSGTVYVASGRMRGDFTSTANSKTVQSHMIVKDKTSYIWSDALPSGFKMAFSATTSQQTFDQASHDPNAKVDYSCSAWSTDESLFALPAGVEFKDMQAASASVQQSGSSATDIHAAQCGACEKAPDASARAQCKAMLAC